MAGEQDSYLRFRIPTKLKDRFEDACTARGVDMSKEARKLLEAFCDAADEGAALVAPLEVRSKPKARKK